MHLRRRDIVRAAWDQLNEQGMSGLSMRGLAGALGVQAGALYWHVTDKSQLWALLAEEILRPVMELNPAAGNQAAVKGFTLTLYRSVRQVRDGAAIVRYAMENGLLTSPVLEVFGLTLRSAGAAQLPAELGAEALWWYTLGVAAMPTRPTVDEEERFAAAVDLIASAALRVP